MTRNEAIKKIKAALRRRSGRTWGVTGGRGGVWGWITIDAPPARRNCDWTGEPAEGGHLSSAVDRADLARLLGVDTIHPQGVSIPPEPDYYDEFTARAEGRTPERYGEPWRD